MPHYIIKFNFKVMKKFSTFLVAIVFLANLNTNAQPNLSEIDYDATLLQIGTNSATLTRANNDLIIDVFDGPVLGKGFTLPTEVGKAYSINCSFTTTATEGDIDWVGVFLITNGDLELEEQWGQVDVYEIIDDYLFGNPYSGGVLTLTYNCQEGDFIRFAFFADCSECNHYQGLPSIIYTIVVEEIIPQYNYSKLNYPEIAVGEIVTGNWNGEDYVIIDPARTTALATGKGFTFSAEADKMYHISCLQTTSEENFIFDTKLYLLQGDKPLSGYLEDEWYIPPFLGDPYLVAEGDLIVDAFSSTASVDLIYTATQAGDLRLLFCDFTKSNLGYIIKITEINILTLPELLNQTTKTISYVDDNLAFTGRGTVADYVEGNTALGFKTNGENYYAVAYKMTLPAGNYVEIHSSKEGDSYLYVYKAGTAGTYTRIAENDNDNTNGYSNASDSYIELNAIEAGDYYIVITDRYPDVAGRYYLTVWNTLTEPENSFLATTTVIASFSCDKDSVNVGKTIAEVTEADIREALGTLLFSGTTTLSETVTIVNNKNVWVIAENKLSATYTATAPDGCEFDAGVNTTVTVKIGYSPNVSIKETRLNQATIYAYNKDIIVRNAEIGSNLSVVDITGRIVVNTVATGSEIHIPVMTTGMYIVRVGAQVAKVIYR